jgi:hypothetical protein
LEREMREILVVAYDVNNQMQQNVTAHGDSFANLDSGTLSTEHENCNLMKIPLSEI